MQQILRKKLSILASFIANPFTFSASAALVIAWIVIGAFKGFPDYWYKTTTVVVEITTFLVVFIVQFSEESETEAIQKKLDALIKSLPEADNKIIGEENRLKGEK